MPMQDWHAHGRGLIFILPQSPPPTACVIRRKIHGRLGRYGQAYVENTCHKIKKSRLYPSVSCGDEQIFETVETVFCGISRQQVSSKSEGR